MKTLIQFTRVWKRGRQVVRTEPCWIQSVSWADGPGNRVKNITTTTDITKAAGFSLATAHDVALQFYTKPSSLVDEQGVVKVEATAELHKACLSALSARAQVRAEFNAALADMFPPELMARIRKAML